MFYNHIIDMNKRLIAFDYARSICAIWIVGFWHYHKYLSPEYHIEGELFLLLSRITMIVLGTFTFLSSFFLKKYEFFNTEDIFTFAKKRFSRFFILLLFSSFTLYLLGWCSLKQVVYILTGTNWIFGEPVFTLWYFSMMIFFYLLTPFIRWKNNTYIFLFSSVLLLLCSWRFIEHIDKRIALYLPLYLLGFSLPTEKFIFFLSKLRYFIVLLSITIGLIWIDTYYASIIFNFIYIITGTFSLLSFCLITFKPYLSKISVYISVSSMVAYLFHRQFYIVTLMLFHSFFCIDFFPLSISPILVFFLIVTSHNIQLYWDNICRKFTHLV